MVSVGAPLSPAHLREAMTSLDPKKPKPRARAIDDDLCALRDGRVTDSLANIDKERSTSRGFKPFALPCTGYPLGRRSNAPNPLNLSSPVHVG